MGIRINKILGYGITNYIGDEDIRFNIGWSKDLYTDRRQEFIDFLIAKKAEIKKEIDTWDIVFTLKAIEESKNWCPADWIAESPFAAEEDNKKRPLVFSPHKDWTRYDNTIDYYESKRRPDGGIKDYTQALGKTYIYPYARYVDIRTGETPGERDLAFEVVRIYHSKLWKELSNEWPKDVIGLTKDEFEKYVWPDVPKDVKLFAEFAKIFKNPLDIYCLRPMIYTYWS